MTKTFDYNDSLKDAIVSNLVGEAFKSIFPLFKSKKINKVKFIKNLDLEEKILSHFNEMYNWAKDLEFIGLGGKPISAIIKSIKLDYSYSLRRKHNVEDVDHSTLNENDFIFLQGNIIIEGDPGSGKTTTLKRLLYKYFLRSEKTESQYSFPILIRFRDIELGYNLYTHIASLLGIKYKEEVEEFQVEVSKVRIVKINNRNKEERYKEIEIRKRTNYFIDETKIEIALVDLFEKNKVLIIMDGLDELRPELFEIFQNQLKLISLKLFYSKIIITTRPNYIKIVYPNFSIYQVNPLTNLQMRALSKLWLRDYKEFLKKLKEKSYYELANRPLFLSFLILLYKEDLEKAKGNLPKYSKDVYEQIIELLIAKWDEDRDVTRMSKYAEFNEKKKLKFLSHLSYYLTYKIGAKIFSREDFIDAYLKIYNFFELPKEEAELVAEEIENHIGIIVKSLYDKYEFSHLALQEYLCAVYIIGSPFTETIIVYLKEYPSPLAFAVSLSTDPSSWLSELIFKMLQSDLNSDKLAAVGAQILDRITIESPYFERSTKLATSLMSLCRTCNCKYQNFDLVFEKFIDSNINIKNSILAVIKDYSITGKNQLHNKVSFKARYVYNNNYPPILSLPMTSKLIQTFL